MASRKSKVLAVIALIMIFTALDAVSIFRSEQPRSLQQETQIFERVDLDQRNRPNQLHVVKYERVSRVLTVCFGSGRCVKHCNVPSYEFDSFRWSFMPDSYYSVRVGASSAGYRC